MKKVLINALLLLMCAGAYSQDNSKYTWGFIVDSDNRPIPYASVSFSHAKVLTNDSGFFRLLYSDEDMNIVRVGYRRTMERGRMTGGKIIMYVDSTGIDPKIIAGYYCCGCHLGAWRIQGIITDSEGTPLINVQIKGKRQTIYTDSVGHFSYMVYTKDKVIIKKPGYQSVKAIIHSTDKNIQIKLHYVTSFF